MMPSSLKGSRKGRERKVKRKPIPIPAALAARLLKLAEGRAPDAPLLLQPSGKPWQASSHYRPVYAAVKAAGLNPTVVTYYAFRHSRITDMLLRGVPAELVADQLDTSARSSMRAQLPRQATTFLPARGLSRSIFGAATAAMEQFTRDKGGTRRGRRSCAYRNACKSFTSLAFGAISFG
jgi:hypothetical protein